MEHLTKEALLAEVEHVRHNSTFPCHETDAGRIKAYEEIAAHPDLLRYEQQAEHLRTLRNITGEQAAMILELRAALLVANKDREVLAQRFQQDNLVMAAMVLVQAVHDDEARHSTSLPARFFLNCFTVRV